MSRYQNKRYQRKGQQIKCYQCNLPGHHKDRCPQLLAKIQKNKDTRWFQENMPDVPLVAQLHITNLELIKSSIIQYLTLGYNCCIKVGAYEFPISQYTNMVSVSQNDPISRHLSENKDILSVTIEELASFIQRKQLNAQLFSIKRGKTLENMIYELKNANIVTETWTESRHASHNYHIGNILVMHVWDEQGWEWRVSDGVESLIIDTYKNFRGDKTNTVEEDMKTISSSLDFTY